jgi:hypothetical protein
MRRVLQQVPDAMSFNRFVPFEPREGDEGRVRFLYEDQGVHYWATEPEGDNPRVWYRENEDGGPWIEEPERLTGFLLQVVLFEARAFPRFGANSISVTSVR